MLLANIGIIILLFHVCHAFVLLTANIDDVKKITRKFISEPFAEKLVELITKATGSILTNVSEENEKNVKYMQQASDNELERIHKAERQGKTVSSRQTTRSKPVDTIIVSGKEQVQYIVPASHEKPSRQRQNYLKKIVLGKDLKNMESKNLVDTPRKELEKKAEERGTTSDVLKTKPTKHQTKDQWDFAKAELDRDCIPSLDLEKSLREVYYNKKKREQLGREKIVNMAILPVEYESRTFQPVKVKTIEHTTKHTVHPRVVKTKDRTMIIDLRNPSQAKEDIERMRMKEKSKDTKIWPGLRIGSELTTGKSRNEFDEYDWRKPHQGVRFKKEPYGNGEEMSDK